MPGTTHPRRSFICDEGAGAVRHPGAGYRASRRGSSMKTSVARASSTSERIAPSVRRGSSGNRRCAGRDVGPWGSMARAVLGNEAAAPLAKTQSTPSGLYIRPDSGSDARWAACARIGARECALGSVTLQRLFNRTLSCAQPAGERTDRVAGPGERVAETNEAPRANPKPATVHAAWWRRPTALGYDPRIVERRSAGRRRWTRSRSIGEPAKRRGVRGTRSRCDRRRQRSEGAGALAEVISSA
jgi:hypothetical protein